MKLSSWIMAARPRTLSLSMTPVAVGAALAWAANRQIHELAVLAALIGSISFKSVPTCTTTRSIPSAEAMGPIASDRRA